MRLDSPLRDRRSGRPGPALWETVGLIAGLRLRLLYRRLAGRGWAAGLVAGALLGGLAIGLGVGSFLLFTAVPAIRTNKVWLAFTLGLFCFLVGVFWVIWPVIAAQVDEAYELNRFLHYPVRPARLYLIQTAAGLLEPAVLFFYPALIGAGLGLQQSWGPGILPTILLIGAFCLMNVTVGRALQNLFLNVLTSRRSAEILLAGFLAALGLAALLPPVDASWLFARLSELGAAEGEDLSEIVRAGGALTDTPPGWLAYGLRAAARGRYATALNAGLGMLSVAALAWVLGLLLLKRFYRGGRAWRRKRPRPRALAPRRGWSLPGLSGETAALFEKEWRSLLGNPKARLLFAVPFFLLILLKVVGAAQLFRYLWGDTWTAILLTLLGGYVLAVLAGQFFVNGFGYDGPAVRLLFLLPPSPRSWLLSRNLAHGLLATLQFLALTALAYLILPQPAAAGIALPACAFFGGLLSLLAMGNLLSCRYPRRYHLSLARRDRPNAASFVAIVISLTALALVTLLLLHLAAWSRLPSPPLLLLLPLLGLVIYLSLLRPAASAVIAARERLIDRIG